MRTTSTRRCLAATLPLQSRRTSTVYETFAAPCPLPSRASYPSCARCYYYSTSRAHITLLHSQMLSCEECALVASHIQSIHHCARGYHVLSTNQSEMTRSLSSRAWESRCANSRTRTTSQRCSNSSCLSTTTSSRSSFPFVFAAPTVCLLLDILQYLCFPFR